MFNTIKYNISISLPFHHFMHGQCNLQNNVYNEREDVSVRAGVFKQHDVNHGKLIKDCQIPKCNNYNFKILVNSSFSQYFITE